MASHENSHNIILRRKKVFKLRMMGISIPKIAESLETTTKTIYDDLAWLRGNAKEFVTEFNCEEDIGLFFKKMQELEEMYMAEYIKAGKIECHKCYGKGDILLSDNKKITCDACHGKGSFEDAKMKVILINKIQELNVDAAKIKTDIGLWHRQIKPVDEDESFQTLIVESRKDRGLLPEPAETITEKKVKIAKIEKESELAKKIREMKDKKGGENK